MKLKLLAILLCLTSTIFAQFDFKLEHTYDSLSVFRTQLYFSKSIRYIGKVEVFDSIKRELKEKQIYKIFDENHNLLKTVESKYPIIKDPNSATDRWLFYIGESKNGKLLFYERTNTYYPIQYRIMDDDGNNAVMDSIYNFTIDSTEELSPIAIKKIFNTDGSAKIQYYSYPELKFIKEYSFSKFESSDIDRLIFRKKFVYAGEKFVYIQDSATINILNLDHSLWKKIKVQIPTDYNYTTIYLYPKLRLDFITENKDSTFRMLYTVLKHSGSPCQELRIRNILSDDKNQILDSAETISLSGPPEFRCSNFGWGGRLFENGNKFIYNYSSQDKTENYSKILNISTLKVDTTFSNNLTILPLLLTIDKKNYYTWTDKDSTKFYDEDFKYKFSTVPINYQMFISSKLVNTDNFIEWFAYDSIRLISRNQNGKELFSCTFCNPPVFSVIKNNDDKLITVQYVPNKGNRTLIYSKNVKPTSLEKYETSINAFVFPNPFTHNLEIQIPDNIESPIFVQLYSIEGKILFSQKYDSKKIEMNQFANYVQGLYFLKLQTKDGRNTIIKLVKQ
jgi:Secretion system C-terminal sorting domain